MGRLPDISGEAMPDELREMVDAQERHYGAVLNSLRQTAHSPGVVLAASAMSRDLARAVRTPSRLSALLNLRVAAIVGCPL